MSKSRFYDRAISTLRSGSSHEVAGDIEDYVKSLILDRALLASEVGRSDSFTGKQLLRELGFSVEENK